MSEPTPPRPEQPQGDVRALVEVIAKSLVDEPDQVSVAAVDEDNATVIELTVAPGDMGKVIGKAGRTARAFRAILNAASVRLDHQFTLEILE